MNAFALPKELERFSGRITDIDTHEMAPAQAWVEMFGEETRVLADYFIAGGETTETNANTANIEGFQGDILPIDENIVNIKGCVAPGSMLPERRIGVMDAMGIGRQIMFPSFMGGWAMSLYKEADKRDFIAPIQGDRRAKAFELIDKYNDWAIKSGKITPRIRPVGIVYGNTPREMYERAKYLIDNGLRAVWIFPAGELPGGKSPAHPDHDPLYAMLAERDVPIVLHIAGDGNFLRQKWNDAPAFEGHIQHIEVSRDPYFMSTLHLAFENFVTVMVLGGVFDRHPRLRFGIIELATYWVGPLIRRMDLWWKSGNSANNPAGDKAYRLPEAPSFYFRRNIRATPFVFEDVARDITHYGLEDVLCFSTDYPHVEGGKNCFKTFYDKVAPLGEEIVEKFFVTNGQLLLPD